MSTESENPGDGSRAEPARRALESLAEMEPELRSAALFAGNAADGKLLAADGDADWVNRARELDAAVRAASEGEFDSAHVALEQGEAFVLAESGYTLVWTTGRFVLASLTRFDARMCLRDLAAEDPGPGAEN
ncbi:MAG: hypothetical protein M9938_07335 [Solirubrobacterales bacterium]|nr:hypothetical protein [Solirubrobacterales bacterium]